MKSKKQRAKSKKAEARQISKNDILWDDIKSLESVTDAQNVALNKVSMIHTEYESAALKYIKQYEHFLGESKKYLYKKDRKRTSARLGKYRDELGYSEETTGKSFYLLDEGYRDVLPPRILLSILIILKLKYAHNTDTWLRIPFRNIDTSKKTSITIKDIVKNKTSNLLPELTITNRERVAFKCITLLVKSAKAVKAMIKSKGYQNNREHLLFDYPKITGVGIIKDFQYLTGKALQRFCNEANIEYLSLDTLRNVTATKQYLETKDIYQLRELLCHKSLKTTQHYIEQQVTTSLLKHNMLTFIREIESEALNLENADNKYFQLGDGATCTNPYDSPDPHQAKGQLCNGKYCHRDCNNRKILLNDKTIWQALVRREYYRTNYFNLMSDKEKFASYGAEHILFNLLLCEYIQKTQQALYQNFMTKIDNTILTKQVDS